MRTLTAEGYGKSRISFAVRTGTILLLIILWLAFPASLAEDCVRLPGWRHLVYPFFHANIFHLAGNCYAAWRLMGERVYGWKKLLPILYGISVLGSLVACPQTPAMGFSAPLYAAAGIGMGAFPGLRRFACTGAILLLGIFLPHVAAGLHLVCFACGCTLGFLHRIVSKYRYDCRRIDG